MKTKVLAAVRPGWNFLTVIPGWPDAGKIGRTMYALPLVLPVLGLLLLTGWSLCIRGPRMRAERAAHQSALLLEDEIAALRLTSSDEQAVESAATTARLLQGLVQSPEDFAAQLEKMRLAAAEHGWSATLRANDSEDEIPADGATLRYRTVRGRMVPGAGNPAAFATLLALLDRLPPAGRSASLTRVAVRADEQAHLSVEFGVRYALSPTNEKTP